MVSPQFSLLIILTMQSYKFYLKTGIRDVAAVPNFEKQNMLLFVVVFSKM